MNVLISTTGVVTIPGRGFSAEGLALEYDNAQIRHDENGVLIPPPPRPFEIVAMEDKDAHPAVVAMRAAEAAVPAEPSLQDVIDMLEAESPGRADTVQSNANARKANG